MSNMTFIDETHMQFEHFALSGWYVPCQTNDAVDNQQDNLSLDITPKNLLCVKIAGILHNVGRHLYLHVYDGLLQRIQLRWGSGRQAEARGSWIGHVFEQLHWQDDNNADNGTPVDEVVERWAHEEATLMMIDSKNVDPNAMVLDFYPCPKSRTNLSLS